MGLGDELPEEVVGGLPGPFPPIRPGHDEVARPIIQDGVDVDVPPHPDDSELVDVYLPQGVHMASLEPFERLGFLDDPDHEPMALEHPVDRAPADLDPSPVEQGVDPQGAPRGALSFQLEDTIGQAPVNSTGASVRAAGLVAEPFHPFFSVILAPVPEGALGDSQKSTDLRASNSLLEMLLDGVKSETNVFPDQGHPSPGAAICVDNSAGKMSCYSTAKEFYAQMTSRSRRTG
jgi:hypothetical protein